MTPRSFVLPLLLLTACHTDSTPLDRDVEMMAQDTIVLRDTLWLRDTVHVYGMGDWQDGFGLSHDPQMDSVWGKEVDYYISDPQCDALAFDFYYGQFRPSDNALSTEFMELLLSDNSKMRPFYRWCFDRTIHMADGSLAEYIGSYARKYVEKYPAEFLAFSASDSLIAERWAEIIAFSGIHEFQYDWETAPEKLGARFKKACKACPDSSMTRLEDFAGLVIEKHNG